MQINHYDCVSVTVHVQFWIVVAFWNAFDICVLLSKLFENAFLKAMLKDALNNPKLPLTDHQFWSDHFLWLFKLLFQLLSLLVESLCHLCVREWLDSFEVFHVLCLLLEIRFLYSNLGCVL